MAVRVRGQQSERMRTVGILMPLRENDQQSQLRIAGRPSPCMAWASFQPVPIPWLSGTALRASTTKKVVLAVMVRLADRQPSNVDR